jgi:allantoinase
MNIRGKRLVLPDGITAGTLVIEAGKIRDIVAFDAPVQGPVIDAADALVSPGLVDSHVHINDPGRTEWEGFATATEAAAAGGITTVVDMPLNSIPATVNAEAAALKATTLEPHRTVNVALWGGVIPNNQSALKGLRDFGVAGCKCFMVPSGVDEFPFVTEADLEVALPMMRDLGLPLIAHAELQGPIDAAELSLKNADPKRYDTYLKSRPNAAEDQAIALLIKLAKKHDAHVHVVHLSSASAVPMIEQAQKDGVKITAETCLHYLGFCAEDIADGATAWKCAPPIRDKKNREALWQALERGVISMVVSDHSPCVPALKAGDFMRAWGGIASLQLGLSVLWTLAKERHIDVSKVIQWAAVNTAALAGFSERKGALTIGRDADVVIWAPEERFTVDATLLRHKNKISPWIGRTLYGVVKTTIVNGVVVYKDGVIVQKQAGELLRRSK